MQRRKKLIFWRIDHRLKQKDMCEKLGITIPHYSNLERGISDPSYELLTKFKEIFKVKDVLDLFEKEKIQNGDSDKTGNINEKQILD